MTIFIIISSIYIFLFILSVKLKDNSIVDIFWGLGFVLIASYYLLDNYNFDFHKFLIYIILFLWGVRLSVHILSRKLNSKQEDKRYAKWRKEWKNFYVRSFFQVYFLQMILMFIISTPLYFIFYGNIKFGFLYLVGITFLLFGLFYETLVDYQMIQFKKDISKKDIVFTGGLYKYSRHPNYFGESMFWLGISLIGLTINASSLIGFFLITFLLLYVSGIPMKEKQLSSKSNRHEYIKSTNKFIPKFW